MSQTPPPPPPPLRVEQIEYQSSKSGRPGILTAVGVISIVIASLGVLSGCAGLVNALVFGFIGFGSTSSRTIPSTAPTTSRSAFFVLSNPMQMPAPQQQIVVAAMNARHALSPPRQAMLNKLLAQQGNNFFMGQISISSVAASISDAGTLPSDGKTPGNDYFVIATGRIEIGDNQAVYSPTAGDDVRVYANGSSVQTSQSRTTAPSMTTFAYSRTASGAGMGAFYLASGGCNFILAVFLLACGILVLKNSQRGRRLHLMYAGIKIPVEVIVTCAYLSMLGTIMSGFAGTPLPMAGMMRTFMVLGSVVPAALGCAYPIALLIVMNRRSVKEYYQPLY